MDKKDLPLERLGTVLDKSLKRLNLSPRLEEYGVWPIWNDTVGATIARNAQPEKIRNGTLFVKVSTPVWMQQLQYMKEMIAEKLNQRLGAEVVKNVFFVIGRLDTHSAEPDTGARAISSSPPASPKSDGELLQSIPDPDVRQAFKKLLAAYARRKQKP
jgi:predicted nucleic acid-binding Zn ribbon protein